MKPFLKLYNRDELHEIGAYIDLYQLYLDNNYNDYKDVIDGCIAGAIFGEFTYSGYIYRGRVYITDELLTASTPFFKKKKGNKWTGKSDD